MKRYMHNYERLKFTFRISDYSMSCSQRWL